MNGQKIYSPLVPVFCKPDEDLAQIVGATPRTLREILSSVMDYASSKGLIQEGHFLADGVLAPLFNGRKRLSDDEFGDVIGSHVVGPAQVANEEPGAFLLTWNPKKFQWTNLSECIRAIQEHGSYEMDWTCRTRQVRIGDRVFLLRQGVEPKGLIASGVAISDVMDGEHWNEAAAHSGKRESFIVADWEIIIDAEVEEPLSRMSLLAEFPDVNWNTQSSGIRIGNDIAEQLEDRWWNHLQSLGYTVPGNVVILPEEIEEPSDFHEGATVSVSANSYERSSSARELCIAHYGLGCSVCGKTLEDTYGDAGKDFIEVHHLVPLSQVASEYHVDPITDLRPVCPNCHAMLHRRSPPMTVEELSEVVVGVRVKR